MKAKDNHGHEYAVRITHEPHGNVLHIDGTPGHWYITSLLKNKDGFPDGLFVDFGQNWKIVNMDEVMSYFLCSICKKVKEHPYKMLCDEHDAEAEIEN